MESFCQLDLKVMPRVWMENPIVMLGMHPKKGRSCAGHRWVMSSFGHQVHVSRMLGIFYLTYLEDAQADSDHLSHGSTYFSLSLGSWCSLRIQLWLTIIFAKIKKTFVTDVCIIFSKNFSSFFKFCYVHWCRRFDISLLYIYSNAMNIFYMLNPN